MTSLNNAVKTADETRRAGRSQREAAVQSRGIVNYRLLDLLQAAAIILVTVKFEGVVTNDLQHWGFPVIERTNPPKNGDEE
ncbi:MAG: hypothetical protein KJ063_17525 [Anaerolineae bacterium]|nr:hypothetical protein [Anaerolineae bacterium]